MDSSAASPWYRDGLNFGCTQCGKCCTGTPGFVWVTIEEITRLAEHLKVSLDQFGMTYLRQVDDRLSLIEKPNFDCIFWEKGVGCTVYEARPTQCRTWPFWPENIKTPSAWRRTESLCPGSGEGRLYSVEEIQHAASQTSE